ncbi:MAG: hypothetical protein KKD86_03960 [Bacteroidetes bacterium]|nr:hypothetical protein [Bacteroidota bacterium]MBU1677996.1 hypothetical protein [Bacteroidota bacterium]
MLKMTVENIKNFQKPLKAVYNDSEIEQINFAELNKYPVIRYGTPDNF